MKTTIEKSLEQTQGVPSSPHSIPVSPQPIIFISDKLEDKDVVVTMIQTISIKKIDFASQPIDYCSIEKHNKEWFEKYHKKQKIQDQIQIDTIVDV